MKPDNEKQMYVFENEKKQKIHVWREYEKMERRMERRKGMTERITGIKGIKGGMEEERKDELSYSEDNLN